MNALHVALYQPDIALNVGAMIRLCACLGANLDIIEPCGFPWDERKIRQSALDYMQKLNLQRHTSWSSFLQNKPSPGRIILMSTKSDYEYTDFAFQYGDILLAGRESAGVPDNVRSNVDVTIGITMVSGLRSINVVNATAMILGEARRQILKNNLT